MDGRVGKKLLIRMALCIVVACGVNILVSLACALFSDYELAEGQPLHDSSWIMTHRGSVPPGTWQERRSAFGYDQVVFLSPPSTFVAEYVRAGWPLPAFDGGVYDKPAPGRHLVYVTSLVVDVASHRIVPLCPMWIGLIGNTFSFATVLYLSGTLVVTLRRRIGGR